MILILSHRDDCHISLVTEKLDGLGGEYVWFDPADFPANASITVAFDRRGINRRLLRTGDRVIDLDRVTAVWVRRPGQPKVADQITDQDQRRWASLECREFLEGLWQTMDCQWIPARPRDTHFGYNKTYHLGLAASLGFLIPDHTVVTNDPDEFVGFYAETGGQMVSKVSCPLSTERDGELHHTFTHVVRRRDAVSYRSVRFAPIIFQEYVPKVLELRVTVVGSRVFAAAIDSQASLMTRDDWRHYDNDRATYLEYELPRDIGLRCVRLTQALGLCFGTIDLVLTPQGEYVFLEINANGQWGWVEALTVMPIAGAIAQLLVSASVCEQEVNHAASV